MRIYSEQKELQEVVCNMCQKHLKVENGILREGCCSIEQQFGYFSTKDGQKEKLDLCEECYESLKKILQIPVEIEEINEFL